MRGLTLSVLQLCVSADGDPGFLWDCVRLRCSVVSQPSLILMDVTAAVLKGGW